MATCLHPKQQTLPVRRLSSMRIIACVKAVPSSTEVKMDPKTNTIVRDGKQAVINHRPGMCPAGM